MKRESARIEVTQFVSMGERLISWDVHCSFRDDESGNRWQSSAGVIATIAEAEEFVSQLSKAIEAAKAERALADSATEKTIEERAKECGTLAMEPNGDFTVTSP